MHRSTVAALVTAAVIGVAGGSVAATVRGHDATPSTSGGAAGAGSSGSPDPSVSPSQSSSPSPSASTTTEPAAQPLLYFSPGRIHDGKRVVRVPGVRYVEALTRTADGYLIAVEAKNPTLTLSTVTPTGTVRRIATVAPGWDVDAGRTRLVGLDVTTEQLTVWNLRSGSRGTTWDQGGARTGDAGWAGDEVLVTGPGEQATTRLYRWDPSTGRTRDAGDGTAYLSVSPGGSYISGAVDRSGGSSDDVSCLRVRSTFLKKNPVVWTTCQWRPYAAPTPFSPDGTRLLAVPSDTDGFGPGRYGVFDASDGPDRLVGDFGTPTGTLGAQWADDEHVYLYGSVGEDPEAMQGTWIKRCDLRGVCRELVRSKDQLTVGSVS